MSSKPSASSDKIFLLEESKKLYWKASGESNLLGWEEDVREALKAAFGIYATCIIESQVPDAWTQEYIFNRRENGPYDELPAFEKKIVDLHITEYYRVQFDWRTTKPKIIPFIAKCCSSSSIDRCKSEYKKEFEDAMTANDPVAYYMVIKRSHTFRGKAASTAEVTEATALANQFPYSAPDTLPDFKKKWDDLFNKRFKNLDITEDQVTPKQRMFAFAKALKSYPHADAVKFACITKLAELDNEGASMDIDKFYNTLVQIHGAEATGSSESLVANSAVSQIRQKLKSGDTKSSTSGRKNSGNRQNPNKKNSGNPKTKEYCEKKSRETGQPAEEIRKGLNCNNCGKPGHISPDCTSPDQKRSGDNASVSSNRSKKSNRGKKKKGKNNGNGTMGSIFTADDASESEGEAFSSFTCCSGYSKHVASIKPDVDGKFDNYTCYSKDDHANVCIFSNPFMLSNLRDLDQPRVIEGLCGMRAHLQRVGDHPIFGTVFVDPRNKYNLVGEPVIRKLGMQFVKSKDDKHQDLVKKSTGKTVLRFHLDPSDGFYKASFLTGKVRTAMPGSIIKQEDTRDRRMMYTNLQMERASKVIALHEALCHPSDEALKSLLESPSLINLDITSTDLKNAREIYGPCAVCLQSKPLPVTGSNPSYDRHEVPTPGEDLHMDIVFTNKTPYLFCMDAASGKFSMVRLHSKNVEHLRPGVETIINYYKGHLRVTRTISSDFEANFRALEQWLNSGGIQYRSRVPYEHEKPCERGMRRVREAMRSKLLELKFQLPKSFLPYLMFHVCDCLNFIPNARSSPLAPDEMVEGNKINFRTDIMASFGTLILVSNKSKGDSNVAKQDIGLCLGRCPNTKGSVWTYLRGHPTPLVRRPLKAMPMTDDWLHHLSELASKSPSDPDTIFEFRPGFEATPADIREQIQSEAEAPPAPLHPSPAYTYAPVPTSPYVQLPSDPAVAPTPERAVSIPERPLAPSILRLPATSPSRQQAPPLQQVLSQLSQQESVTASPVAPRRVTFGSASAPASSSTALVSPAKPALKASVSPPSPAPTRRSARVPKPNLQYASDYVVNMAKVHNYDYLMEMEQGLRAPDSDLSYVATGSTVDDDPRIDDLFAFMGDHEDDGNNMVAMQITLEAALKTQYKEDVEACAIKEIQNVVKHKTWTYLKTLADAERSVHTNVLPCQMVVKDKRDSHGQLLLWKGRLANGGHRTDPEAYLPFDKTSPTATIDAVWAFLAVAQRNKMRVENNDVPSAYLNALLPKGQKHVMRISKTLAKYVCAADNSAEAYLQPDGSLLVQLQRALYGLPEAGRLWHELITDILRKCGYKQKEGDSCVWKYVEKKDGKIINVSFILLYVDDILHIFKGINGGTTVHTRLHTLLGKNGLPKLTSHELTPNNTISFLGLSIAMLPGHRFYVSQPGYIAALVANFPTTNGRRLRHRESPLPSDFSTRKLQDTDEVQLNEADKSKYLKWVQSLAWTTRSRLDICCAVAHKQTNCATPRVIDVLDLEHMIGYLASTLNMGVVIDIDEWNLTLFVDVAWATHWDRKSHTGGVVTIGSKRRVPIIWKSGKQKVVAASSTEGELIGLSDYLDLVLLARSYFEFLLMRIDLPIQVMQDNTSTITVSYLGRPSLHSRRRFVDIRYFWFKQFLDNDTVKLVYCPSGKMLADLLASVRSGEAFKGLRDALMGHP